MSNQFRTFGRKRGDYSSFLQEQLIIGLHSDLLFVNICS
ncbi:hypothetical protein AC73_4978 [Escherichia coli 2-427-07_S4_C1]|uniref:Uncharacterized protein n=1 Tax=Escherichia coli DEC2D TaxID=868141 RepID=A0A828U1I7_ECOLX|nr:hypothetical protein ECDEC1A_3975 [Escherichia coli DEC1A]EHU07808.1 hypothetical protein ECDEC1B_4198 [Escherichia coli DEC1B]EHU18126.1 hypothetical protein ECDEC1D_4463 [Escherichia coli DEC1D]EHU21401.1 hypothetical protein ECDEC1E_4324 [Escherichia coli DEC1E]EHU35497.1 hypothetical protein ECDEC2B_4248 [Escherichia coli DEC2B]EHU39919.1 hypothetical protein ECDEC2D_4158 [Escherichia coli DEC2D]EYD80898.1 hypothetical protein AC26_4211 [Escherichia coli 1-176-05_S3_C2]KDY38773.1 hypo